jgi:hypothetical protein
VTAYRLQEGPSHATLEGASLLSGYYTAVFATDDGARTTRYLTDKGRASMLDRLDGGQRRFSQEEIEEMTVEADLGSLEARFDAEAGEGG